MICFIFELLRNIYLLYNVYNNIETTMHFNPFLFKNHGLYINISVKFTIERTSDAISEWINSKFCTFMPNRHKLQFSEILVT